jgi:hypothetical protein
MLKFWGIEKIEQEANQFTWVAGTFYDYEIARQALLDVLNKTSIRGARIIRRVDLEAKKSTTARGSNN